MQLDLRASKASRDAAESLFSCLAKVQAFVAFGIDADVYIMLCVKDVIYVKIFMYIYIYMCQRYVFVFIYICQRYVFVFIYICQNIYRLIYMYI